MLKKRLIFTLLYADGSYMLSRNFGLQSVGDLQWLRENYDFDAIAQSIDELVVLNVARGEKNSAEFADHLRELSANYFLPIAAGGGIRTVDDGYRLFNANADKLVLNSPLIDNPELVRSLAQIFGRQSIVASIDCRRIGRAYRTFINNGQTDSGVELKDAVQRSANLGAGEIYLTSMDRDGTGFGYDLEMVAHLEAANCLPLILSGGVGRYQHFCDGLLLDGVTGASTANIYNFIVGGLSRARAHIVSQGIPMAAWDFGLEALKGSALAGEARAAAAGVQ
jgi:imidazole glycerol-phosphate synthase subunit HisF